MKIVNISQISSMYSWLINSSHSQISLAGRIISNQWKIYVFLVEVLSSDESTIFSCNYHLHLAETIRIFGSIWTHKQDFNYTQHIEVFGLNCWIGVGLFPTLKLSRIMNRIILVLETFIFYTLSKSNNDRTHKPNRDSNIIIQTCRMN